MAERLRLLLAAPYFFPKNHGGAVQVYHQLFRHLDGFDVTIVAPSEGVSMDELSAFDRTAQADHGYEVLRIGRFEHRLPRTSSVRQKAWDTIDFFRSTSLQWRRAVNHVNPHVVVCGGTFAAGWLMRQLPRGTTHVNYIHGEELTLAVSGPVRAYLYRRQLDALHRAHLNIVVSEYTQRVAQKVSGLPTSAFVVHPNFVDQARFVPPVNRDAIRDRLGWRDHLVLLTVARLVPRKGVDYSLQAIAEGIRQGSLPSTVRYFIGGRGPQERELRILCDSLGLNRNVTFAGYLPERELPDYYGAADIFLHPNREIDGDFEGFGLVFLEANACGTPVIGGRDGGSIDAILDGRTGYVVDGRDVSAIRCALERLVKDQPLRAAFGAQGVARIQSQFTLSAARARLVETLRDVQVRVRSLR